MPQNVIKISEKDLLPLIDPQCVALFWIDEHLLVEQFSPFKTIDYLLDGAVTETLGRLDRGSEKESGPFFWMGESFGHPFAVVHVQSLQKSLLETAEQLAQIVEKVELEGEKKVWFLTPWSEGKGDLLKKLVKLFHQYLGEKSVGVIVLHEN